MGFDLATLDLPPMARFGAVLFILLFTPYIARRLHLPTVVIFIVGGMIIGPHCLGIVPKQEGTAEFFAELGKLLLMFFVGLEIDLRQFRLNRGKSIVFGVMTFALPLVAGTGVALAFGYAPVAAFLIGSLLASHTLIAYPIVTNAGLGKLPAVTITVGATILTDILSLLILAICLTIHRAGFEFWSIVLQLFQLGAFIFIMLAVVGPVGRWAIDRLGHTEEAAFILLLTIVAGGATIAEALQLEGILGAFLAGLAVNAAVRDTPAREKVEFLGNAFFVPAFFIVTGFLIDLRVFVATLWSNPGLVAAIVLGLIGAKWLAAEGAGRLWGLAASERGLMASLTMPQVAATLAAAMVGYQALNPAGERLINEAMLNTILVLVVATAVVGPILTERYARRIGAASPQPAPAVATLTASSD